MKPAQPFADLRALAASAATVKKSLTVRAKCKIGVSGCAPADHFRGVTKLIVCGKRWASDRFATRRVANAVVAARKSTTEKCSAVQAEGKREVSDHFRGATKMVVYGKVRPAVYVVGIRRFSTQCEENLNEVPA